MGVDWRANEDSEPNTRRALRSSSDDVAYLSTALYRHVLGSTSSLNRPCTRCTLCIQAVRWALIELPQAPPYTVRWAYLVVPFRFEGILYSHHPLGVASRTLHSTCIAAATSRTDVSKAIPDPIVAQRGSTQLSLETPNNKAGVLELWTLLLKLH